MSTSSSCYNDSGILSFYDIMNANFQQPTQSPATVAFGNCSLLPPLVTGFENKEITAFPQEGPYNDRSGIGSFWDGVGAMGGYRDETSELLLNNDTENRSSLPLLATEVQSHEITTFSQEVPYNDDSGIGSTYDDMEAYFDKSA